MLAIRMQRTGRSGHAQFRIVVQDARRTPTSGNVVTTLGHYNPHTKVMVAEKEKIAFYLEHGAQPSDRIARLLKKEGVKLPKWVKLNDDKERAIRNPEKLRRNRPAEAAAPAEVPAPEAVEKAETAVAEEVSSPAAAEGAAPEPATPAASESETPAAPEPESSDQA